jgi:hypothetical protein
MGSKATSGRSTQRIANLAQSLREAIRAALHPGRQLLYSSANVRTAQHALPHLKRRISTDIVTGRPKQDRSTRCR